MESERLYCIRGAVCAENTAESITQNVGELCQTLFSKNDLNAQNIVSLQFTVTPDLDVLNPATALRHADTSGMSANIPLFCSAEPVIKNMKPKVIRVLVTIYKPYGFTSVPVYLNGAQSLRPDLNSNTRIC